MPDSDTAFAVQSSGKNGLPRVVLTSGDGAVAEVYLHGAHVTSWIPAGGEERLFLSSRSEFGSQAAIRGGVPVIFPQFSTAGPLQRHGFARNMTWDFIRAQKEGQAAEAVFRLRDNDESRKVWPHAFTVELAVRVGGQKLELTLEVSNPGPDTFTFTGALHTYLRVAEIRETTILGLQGSRYRENADPQIQAVQFAQLLPFQGEVDRIYPDSPRSLIVNEKLRQTQIDLAGFPDVVTWNPGAERGASLPDLESGGFRRMLCVEAALIGRPVTLAPGESWNGKQRLSAILPR